MLFVRGLNAFMPNIYCQIFKTFRKLHLQNYDDSGHYFIILQYFFGVFFYFGEEYVWALELCVQGKIVHGTGQSGMGL